MSRMKKYYEYDIPKSVVSVAVAVCSDYYRREQAINRSLVSGDVLDKYIQLNGIIDPYVSGENKELVEKYANAANFVGNGADMNGGAAAVNIRAYDSNAYGFKFTGLASGENEWFDVTYKAPGQYVRTTATHLRTGGRFEDDTNKDSTLTNEYFEQTDLNPTGGSVIAHGNRIYVYNGEDKVWYEIVPQNQTEPEHVNEYISLCHALGIDDPYHKNVKED